ncbi:hypothetical protein [Streptococcus sp.]|uniref:hypothetical protein n=1 Tax=Streptococcus sp. TaxID=1306 RepID=UPI00391A8058
MTDLLLSMKMSWENILKYFSMNLMYFFSLYIILLFIPQYHLVWIGWYFYFLIRFFNEWAVSNDFNATSEKDGLFSKKNIIYHAAVLVLFIGLRYTLFPLMTRYTWALAYRLFEAFREVLPVNDKLMTASLSIYLLLIICDSIVRLAMLLSANRGFSKHILVHLLKYLVLETIYFLIVFGLFFSIQKFLHIPGQFISLQNLWIAIAIVFLVFLTNTLTNYKVRLGIDLHHF